MAGVFYRVAEFFTAPFTWFVIGGIVFGLVMMACGYGALTILSDTINQLRGLQQ